MSALGILGKLITQGTKQVSPGALPKNLQRAQSQGYDVDNKLYHATNADKIDQFRTDLIGSNTDEGFYGKGFYFSPYSGEAGYYGKNVGEYVVKGNMLDLRNTTDDYTLGGVKKFVDWANKLNKINMLDDATEKGLKGAEKLLKYFDENIEYKIGQNPDGTDGVFATIKDPTRKSDVYKDKEYPFTVDTKVDARGFFPETKEQAREQLLNGFAFQMQKNPYKEIDYFEGWNDDIYTSLSDYIRVGGKGSAELTEKAKKYGYDGILAPGDEVVVFEPQNIRSTSAEFDPKKSDSKNVMASMGGITTLGSLGALAGLDEGT